MVLSFLHAASEVVERMSAGLSLGHPWITSPKKADYYFKVHLTKQGAVKNVVRVGEEKDDARENYQHFKKNNHCSAPLFTLDEALRREDQESFLERQVFGPMEALYDIASEHVAIKELWSRIKKHRDESIQFLTAIKKAVLATDEIAEEDFDSKTVVVFLDNHDRVAAENSISFFSTSSRNELVGILRSQSQPNTDGSAEDIFGDVGPLVTAALPKIKAGGLVQFSPYERNRDTQAYERYGQASLAACPMTQASVDRIYDTLMALTSPGFRNKVWSYTRDPIGKKEHVDRQTIILPDLGKSGAKETQSMIEATPLPILDSLDLESEPQEDAELTDLEMADDTIQEYKRLAVPVLLALEGRAHKYPEARYLISVVQKYGKGAPVKSVQLSVLFEELVECLNFWISTIDATPNRTFGYYADKKRVVTNESEAIRPFEVPRILNRCWKQNAGVDPSGKFIRAYDSQISHSTFTASAALDLFLFQDRRVAAAMINQIARHHIWLMYDVAHRDRHIQSALLPSRKQGKYHCRCDVLKLLGLIAILYRVQENLMSDEQVQEAVDKKRERQATIQDAMSMEITYRMGRALALADLLHRRKFKTSSQFPSEFVGESYFSSLIRGIQIRESWSRFVSRVRHIEKWAQRIAFDVADREKQKKSVDPRNQEIAKYFYWFSKEMREISGSEIPDRFSASHKCLFTSGFYSLR